MQIVNKTNAREKVLIAILLLSGVVGAYYFLRYQALETQALIMDERIADATDSKNQVSLLSSDSSQSISEVTQQVTALKQQIKQADQLLADSLDGLIDSQDQQQVAKLRNQLSGLFSKHNLTLLKSSTESGDLAQIVGLDSHPLLNRPMLSVQLQGNFFNFHEFINDLTNQPFQVLISKLDIQVNLGQRQASAQSLTFSLTLAL